MKSLFLIIAGNHWKQFNRVHDYGDLVTFKLPCQNTMTQETCRRKEFNWRLTVPLGRVHDYHGGEHGGR